MTYASLPGGPKTMKSHLLSSLTLVALLALPLAPAFADDVADTTAPEILHTQHVLREKLDNPTGEYRNLSSEAIAKMRAAQDRVFAMLDGVASLDQLNKDQKVMLSNDLDQIKYLLANNEGNRLICHREKKTGSNMIQRVCETAAQRDADAEESQRSLQHANNRLDGM